jgi:hypothetical protein
VNSCLIKVQHFFCRAEASSFHVPATTKDTFPICTYLCGVLQPCMIFGKVYMQPFFFHLSLEKEEMKGGKHYNALADNFC